MRFQFELMAALVFGVGAMAKADNKVGNGGNVVRCESKGELKFQLLDFYESNLKRASGRSDAFELAANAFLRLRETAPKVADAYLKRLSKMQEEIEFKEKVELTVVPDSAHLFKPQAPDCQVLQIAIRRKIILPGEKRFIIRKDLWDELPIWDRAGLITHEIIYEHFSKLGEQDSVKARKVNSLLYSSSKDFWKTVKELEIPIYP